MSEEAAIVVLLLCTGFGMGVAEGCRQMGVVDGFANAIGILAGVAAFFGFGLLLAPARKK